MVLANPVIWTGGRLSFPVLVHMCVPTVPTVPSVLSVCTYLNAVMV